MNGKPAVVNVISCIDLLHGC